MNQFTKLAETPEQLLTRLEGRGVYVQDREAALAYLRFVGGYRLKGFWFHLTDPGTKKFRTPVNFSDIVDRYEFDRQLRKLTFDEIGRLEIAIRCSISNHLSLKHGPHWFIHHPIFAKTSDWSFGSMIRTIEDAAGRSKAPFITHYSSHYGDPYLPPSWGVTECVTFGFWSRTYSILKDSNEKKAIAKRFRVDEPDVFASWLHCLTYLRNMICHHSRILRAKLVVSPQKYKKRSVSFNDPNTFHAAATVINFLLRETGMQVAWKQDLQDLFARFPAIDPNDIGFRSGWETTW